MSVEFNFKIPAETEVIFDEGGTKVSRKFT